MSESKSWTDQWFTAQQQFTETWSELGKASTPSNSHSPAELWAQGFENWRQSCAATTQPDLQPALQKCVDMGKAYFTMAEQVSKGMAQGESPLDAINQWLEQLKANLQQFSNMPGFDSAKIGDFMQQWFNPSQSWQQMAAMMTPQSQSAWQQPGFDSAAFKMGEMFEPFNKLLSAPGIGYFREPQEQQQLGVQLTLNFQQANAAFNQALLRVAFESIQDYQARLLKADAQTAPKSLRELFDQWIQISEEHYAEYAMSDEYQSLYGDMVNRLMIVKRHYSNITDDFLGAMNLPNMREVDTMQQRLQQLRRENVELRNEIKEIKSILAQPKPATAPTATATRATITRKKSTPSKKIPAAKKSAPAKKAPAPKKAATSKVKIGA